MGSTAAPRTRELGHPAPASFRDSSELIHSRAWRGSAHPEPGLRSSPFGSTESWAAISSRFVLTTVGARWSVEGSEVWSLRARWRAAPPRNSGVAASAPRSARRWPAGSRCRFLFGRGGRRGTPQGRLFPPLPCRSHLLAGFGGAPLLPRRQLPRRYTPMLRQFLS